MHHLVDAFAGVGPIADDIAQAIDLGNPLRTNVCEDSLKSFQVGVDITDDRAQRRFLKASSNADEFRIRIDAAI